MVLNAKQEREIKTFEDVNMNRRKKILHSLAFIAKPFRANPILVSFSPNCTT